MCEAMGLCYGNRVFIVILVVPVFLMSMANSYSFLSYLSIPSIMIAILGMLCTFFYSFSELLGGKTSNQPLVYFDLERVLGRFGLAMYIFDGNAIVVNIRAEAGEKKKRYSQILKNSIVFTIILFVIYSSICYYVYREQTQPIFTMSLVPVNSLIIFILTCVCINALTSYPVQILAAFNVIERFDMFKTENGRNSLLQKVLIRFSVILSTTLITFTVTTFTDFINIAGAIGSLTVAFILPEIFYLKVFGDKMSTAQKAGCVSISIIGTLGASYSVYFSV